MSIELTTPTHLEVRGLTQEQRRRMVKTYRCRSVAVDYEIRRLEQQRRRFVDDPEGQERLHRQLEELRGRRWVELAEEVGNVVRTYSGFWRRLEEEGVGTVDYPTPFDFYQDVRWFSDPPPLRPYQEAAVREVLAAAGRGPVRVEVGTGLGKTRIYQELIGQLARPTVVTVPSTNLLEDVRDRLRACLGDSRVGQYGDGKKQVREVTVATCQSLARVQPGSKDWCGLSKARVLIGDESHRTPAATLQQVLLGLLGSVPIRIFGSATQMRGDGLGPLLDGLTGPTVFRMGVREGVEQGWLARPVVTVYQIDSALDRSFRDPNREVRHHLFRNRGVIRTAADLANKFVQRARQPVLILIDEIEQFQHLLPLLRVQVGFAHGPLSKTPGKRGGSSQQDLVPEQYRESRVSELVREFNRGDLPVLVGTSCVAEGTDMPACGAVLYLMGSGSPTQVWQALGRGTRGGERCGFKNPWTGELKTQFHFVDFAVMNRDVTRRHYEKRLEVYREAGAEPRVVGGMAQS